MSTLPFFVDEQFKMKPGLIPFNAEDLAKENWLEDKSLPRFQETKRALQDYRLPISRRGIDLVALDRELEFARTVFGVAEDMWDFYMRIDMNADFALLEPTDDKQVRLAYSAVAWPSGWNPKEKLGMTFYDIHVDVPEFNAAKNLKVSQTMSQVLLSKPWRRYVWTLTQSPSYNQEPSTKAPNVDYLFYRVEVQTTIPTPGGWVLFIIQVWMEELANLQPEQISLVKTSINSMSEAVLEYKRLHAVKEILNAKY